MCFSTWDMSIARWGRLEGYTGNKAYNRKPGIGFFDVITDGLLIFIGTENMVMSSEDTIDPRRQMPKGMMVGIIFTVLALLTTVLSCSASPNGLTDFIEMDAPIQSILQYQLGDSVGVTLTSAFTLVVAFFAAYANAHAVGRIIYALARGGENRRGGGGGGGRGRKGTISPCL